MTTQQLSIEAKADIEKVLYSNLPTPAKILFIVGISIAETAKSITDNTSKQSGNSSTINKPKISEAKQYYNKQRNNKGIIPYFGFSRFKLVFKVGINGRFNTGNDTSHKIQNVFKRIIRFSFFGFRFGFVRF